MKIKFDHKHRIKNLTREYILFYSVVDYLWQVKGNNSIFIEFSIANDKEKIYKRGILEIDLRVMSSFNRMIDIRELTENYIMEKYNLHEQWIDYYDMYKRNDDIP